MNQSVCIPVERDKHFEPRKFFGYPSYSSVMVIEHDPRLAGLVTIDIRNIRLVTMLRKGESFISGEVSLVRLREETGLLPLDGNVLEALLRHEQHIPKSWTGYTRVGEGLLAWLCNLRGSTTICFAGAVYGGGSIEGWRAIPSLVRGEPCMSMLSSGYGRHYQFAVLDIRD